MNEQVKKWTEETDAAFDAYYDIGPASGSLNSEQKEQVFKDVLYPAYRVIAFSIISRRFYGPYMQRSLDDFANELVSGAFMIAFKYKQIVNSNRFGYIYTVMKNFARDIWRKEISEYNRTVSLQDSVDDTDDLTIEDRIFNNLIAPELNDNQTAVANFIPLCLQWWEKNEKQFIALGRQGRRRRRNRHLCLPVFKILLEATHYPINLTNNVTLNALGATTYTLRVAFMEVIAINRILFMHYLATDALPENIPSVKILKKCKNGKLPFVYEKNLKNRCQEKELYGIQKNPDHKRWDVVLRVNRKAKRFGTYDTLEEAKAVRDKAFQDFRGTTEEITTSPAPVVQQEVV